MGRESMRKNCLLNCRLEKDCFEWVVGDLVVEGNSSRLEQFLEGRAPPPRLPFGM